MLASQPVLNSVKPSLVAQRMCSADDCGCKILEGDPGQWKRLCAFICWIGRRPRRRDAPRLSLYCRTARGRLRSSPATGSRRRTPSARKAAAGKEDAGLLGRPAPGSVENDGGGESRSARVGRRRAVGRRSPAEFRVSDDDAARRVQHVGEQHGAGEGRGDGGEQAEEFRRAEGFGEEVHVQLHFLSGSLSAPGWFGWRVFCHPVHG